MCSHDQWINNPQPNRTSHFIQRDVLMEPRRLRSAGTQRPLMLPDMFKRGGPRVQEQTFGSQTSQREAVSILQDTTVITEQEAKAIIGRINPRKPINIATMGITASEAKAGLQQKKQLQRSPAQCIGPLLQGTKPKPANHPVTAEIKTLTYAQNDHNNAAQRTRRPRRTRIRTGMKGRNTMQANWTE